MRPGMILLALLAVSALLLAGLWQWSRGRAAQDEALAMLRRERGEQVERGPLDAVDQRLRRTRLGAWLQRRLRAAGVDTRPAGALLVAAGAAAAGYLAGLFVLPRVLALPLAAAGVAACEGYLRRRQAQRTEDFVAQLPDLARTLSNAAAAGLALPSALELAAGDLDEPAKSVLAHAVEQLRVGQSVGGALERVEELMPSREVAVLVSTLVIQQRAGGDVVRALRGMAHTLEERRQTAREIRTELAGAKQSSYLVALIGVGMVFLLDMMSPGAFDQLTGTWPGRAILLFSGSLLLVGFALIRRMTRIPV